LQRSLAQQAWRRSPISPGNGNSVLHLVADVSGVPGGSVAASYYVRNMAPNEVGTLTAEGNLTDASQVFEQYRDALGVCAAEGFLKWHSRSNGHAYHVRRGTDSKDDLKAANQVEMCASQCRI
jgi:hypothetical protein